MKKKVFRERNEKKTKTEVMEKIVDDMVVEMKTKKRGRKKKDD